MSVWKCPHCTSVVIVVDGTSRDICPKRMPDGVVRCGGILDRLDEPDAGNAIRAAFYGHDHGFTAETAVA